MAAEDCLFVNVFKPSNATEGSKLPVWIWITGGGYANDAWINFNETGLVKESADGIVFLEFTYRVGALGFLASDQVRQDGDLNVGLLDQRKLLHWVQMYIHKVRARLLPAFPNRRPIAWPDSPSQFNAKCG